MQAENTPPLHFYFGLFSYSPVFVLPAPSSIPIVNYNCVVSACFGSVGTKHLPICIAFGKSSATAKKNTNNKVTMYFMSPSYDLRKMQ